MTAQLKSLAERIERLMDERDGIQSDIRDIYTEAKSHGYVPKVLRKAITRKRMDAGKRDEEDSILELYEGALGPVGKAVAAVRAGSTWKDAAADHNVPRATLARAVKSQKLQTDTDITKTTPERAASLPQGKPDQCVSKAADAGRPMPGEITQTTPDTPSEGAGTTDKPDGPGSALATIQEAPAALEGEELRRGSSVCVPNSTSPCEERPGPETYRGSPQHDACSTGDDPNPLPSFLRRNGVASRKSASHPDEREKAAM